jgi:hypothetical protein
MNSVITSPPSRRLAPYVVYLDLNKWIDLARAESAEQVAKKYLPALRAAEQLVSVGQAVFPLSSAHFMEVAKIGDETRRRNLARLMASFSQGWFLTSASSLLVAELRKAIAGEFGKPLSGAKIVALTRSLKSVFEVPGERRSTDFDDTIFSLPGALEKFLATARVSRDFVGRWKTFADQHETGRALLRDAPRELHKKAYCVLVTTAIQYHLQFVLHEFHLTWEDFAGLGPDGCVRLLERVPSLDVEINLFVERNRHRDRRIAPNDEIDLGFLSVAVPYCRMVVTERFWASLVHRRMLDVKYGTQVDHDLNSMILAIDAALSGQRGRPRP